MLTLTITVQPTWDSYGRKATLISFRVLATLATLDLPISAKRPSGQAAEAKQRLYSRGSKKIKCLFKCCMCHLWNRETMFIYAGDPNRLTVREEDVCRFVSGGGILEVINESTNWLERIIEDFSSGNTNVHDKELVQIQITEITWTSSKRHCQPSPQGISGK